MTEGQKIRKIREIRNYTQEYLADQLGISVKSYGKIENGETSLSISRLQQIAKVLQVDPLDVLRFDEKQVFNHCMQSGNGNSNVLNQDFTKEREHYQSEVEYLKSEVAFLRKLLDKQTQQT